MADYQLIQPGATIQQAINIALQIQSSLAAETAAREAADALLASKTELQAEVSRAEAAEALLATISSLQSEVERATGVEGSLQALIDAIAAKIPAAASDSNQLADKNFVNSSVATATAEFRGTYNLVTNLSLTTSATHSQIATALGTTISTADNNDYCFVLVPTETSKPTEISHFDRYKYNGTSWSYEYTLNNSSFTSDEWAAIQSGITSELVAKLTALPTNADLQTALNAKYEKPGTGIPKTDMASGVQTSLGKADTAYQKPGTGIPKTDLASDVQTSLGKADSALQSHQDISGKADKDTDAVKDNIAQFDANGNPVDNGISVPGIFAQDKFVKKLDTYDFTGFVAEIYVLPAYLVNDNTPLTRLGIRRNGDYIYVYNNVQSSTYLWNARLAVSGITDNTVIELRRYTGTLPSNTLVGYIVFKNSSKLSTSETSASVRLNIVPENVSNLSLCPQITTYLKALVRDGEVTTAKIADGAVIPYKTDFDIIYKSSATGYEGDIEELYFLPEVMGSATRVNVRNYGDDIIVSAFDGSGELLWKVRNDSSAFINGECYELVCTTSGGNAAVNDVCGYIVFKNITHFNATTSASDTNDTVDLVRATALYFQPKIFAFVNAASVASEVLLPAEIVITQSDRLLVFYRDIVTAFNPYKYEVVCVCSVGTPCPRYFEYKPNAAAVGKSYSLTVSLYDDMHKKVATASTTIKVVANASSPVAGKNILLIGASTLYDGTVVKELNRRFTASSGDGNYYNPTGLGLSNISFVGRTSTSESGVKQESQSGWQWKDYATSGRSAYRFFINDITSYDIREGAVYAGNGTLKFTVTEINMADGYISCTYSGSGTQPDSGTLTKDSGDGSDTIAYASYNIDSRNPFWDNDNSELDFSGYITEYCGGQLDILVSYLGINDIFQSRTPAETVETYIQPFLDALHEQSPGTKVILCNLHIPSPFGGMGKAYGATSRTYWNMCAKFFDYIKALNKLIAEDDYSSWVSIASTFQEFDAENLYPEASTKTVCNRSEETETIQNDGVHPTSNGKKALADSIYHKITQIL